MQMRNKALQRTFTRCARERRLAPGLNDVGVQIARYSAAPRSTLVIWLTICGGQDLAPYLWKQVLSWSAMIAVVMTSLNYGFSQERRRPVPKPDAPFAPSVNEVVDMMLRTAEVTDKDAFYDLGCGDGRIVISAASKYGAHWVGVDINPIRIKESKRNARKSGVSQKVTFIEQDLFKTDLSQATVVVIYLDPGMNRRARRRARPNAREKGRRESRLPPQSRRLPPSLSPRAIHEAPPPSRQPSRNAGQDSFPGDAGLRF
jgi:hypothetical protein